MKIIVSLLLIFSFGCTKSGNQMVQVSIVNYAEFDSLIQIYSDTLSQIIQERESSLNNSDVFIDNDDHKDLQIEYNLDTLQIWSLMSLMIDKDFSTSGMNYASGIAREGVNKLIDKYYTKLENRLNKSERKELKEAHQSWETYRDREMKLNRITHSRECGGPGTIQTTFAASSSLAISVNRLERYFHYLIDMESLESLEYMKNLN